MERGTCVPFDVDCQSLVVGHISRWRRSLIMWCEICRNTLAKYKCPSCRIPYCSVSCWKSHKTIPCKPPQATAETSNYVAKEHYQFPTVNTVPLDKLQLLGGSERLKEILDNPHVRTILSAVNESPKPGELLHDAMQEPIFVEFVDECMRLLYPPTKEEIEEARMWEDSA